MLGHGPLSLYLYKNSVQSRGDFWRSAIATGDSHPLFGVGLDRYGAYFKEFREVDYPLRYGFEITSSNAHNTIIQIFATAGILVGSCYLLILLTIFIRSIKLVIKLDQNERRIVLALLTAWVGFQAQSLISIDNIGISIWNWVLGGSLLGINRYYTINSGTTSNNSDKKEKKQVVQVNIFQPIISTVSVLLALLVCVPLYNFERSSNIVRGVLQSQNQDTKFMVEKYTDRIISNSWVDPYYKYQAALALADIGQLSKSFDVVNGLHLSDSNNLDYLDWLANYYEKNQDFKNAIYYRKYSMMEPNGNH
jgi:hypothetical protein